MGISEFQVTENLPDNLKCSLPTIEEIENELKHGKRNERLSCCYMKCKFAIKLLGWLFTHTFGKFAVFEYLL